MMKMQEKLLNQEEVRKACEEALEDEDKLIEALKLLFREGMQDHVYLPGVEDSFARRTIEMYDEFQRQLENGSQSPGTWLMEQLEDCGADRERRRCLAGGAAAAAAELHMGDHAEYMTGFCSRIEDMQGADRPEKLLIQYMNTPLQSLFLTWKKYPVLNAEQRKRAACLLAMLGYIEIKTNPEGDAAADLSFDSVCMLASAITEIMCRPAQKEDGAMDHAQNTAMVCGIMCCQYLWVGALPVCMGCMRSLVKQAGLFFRYLGRLLSGVKDAEKNRVKLEAAMKSYDFESEWQPLLEPAQRQAEDRNKNRESAKGKQALKLKDKMPE